MAKKNYPLGCIESEYDPRDYAVAFTKDDTYGKLEWPERDEIPDIYDSYDQEYGTCVAQSLRYGPHRHYKLPFGVNFLYGLARAQNAMNTPGMSMRVANDFFVKYGLAPLTADPTEYEVPDAIRRAKLHQDELMQAADPYKGWTYARLMNVDEIKAAIRDRRHITFRMTVSKKGLDKANFFRGDGKNAIGDHAMVVRGYGPRVTAKGKTIEAVTIRNSWGEDWGVFGDCFMTWEDVLRKNEIYVFFPPAQIDPVPDPVIIPRRTLKKGMSGEDVLEAQKLLLKHGFFPANVEPKGNFGSTTQKAVIAFQKANGLVTDGIIGIKTWAALDANPLPAPVGRVGELIAYLKERVGDIYVWGAQGQADITEAWIRKMETSTTNADRAIKLWENRKKYGKQDLRAFDCSGLIMYYLYNLKRWLPGDRSANGLYSLCQKITRDELNQGDLVFRHNGLKAYHVGVYIGDGKVIEAKGRDDGVVLREIGTDYWNKYGRLAVLEG